MTEAEWLTCTDPRPMLEFLRGKASRRKMALWAVACYRAVLATGHGFLKALDVVERYAEGRGSDAELQAMHQTYHTSLVLIRPPTDPCDFASLQAGAFTHRLHHLPAVLLRDIFGNPFRRSPPIPPAVSSWNDRLVPRLAAAIYDERRFGDLSILADALPDAGCDDKYMIAHCRGEGPHVPGCWSLDLILGKE
jgi:hypothetical protein